jgi:hypothetical protein
MRWDPDRGKFVKVKQPGGGPSFPAQLGRALIRKGGESVSYGGAPEKVKAEVRAELLAARRAINTALRVLKTMGY